MEARRANAIYLPEIRFPDRLRVTADVDAALADADLIVWAVP